MLKIFLQLLLFVSFLQATSITAQKDTFSVNEDLTFTATAMSGDSTDWIGVYPVGASNAWENVRSWTWTRWNSPKTSGTLTIHGLSAGEYEVRAFFKNSYTVEAVDTFTVAQGGQNNPVTISTNKAVYSPNESISVTLSNMLGNNKDWIGIYPVGSDNSWGNVRAWKWTGGINDGTITLYGVDAGEYEVRAFFNNTYTVEAVKTFTVAQEGQNNPVSISTNKAVYSPNESISITLSNMLGDNKDWIGIYPVGSDNSWGNVRAWKWTEGIINGTITLSGLEAGEYEARAFFNNSYHLETIDTFSVVANNGGDDDGEAKIFIIGDSTVHNTSVGEMGWGSKLGTYMHIPANVSNRARSGASSKSYKYESASHHDWTYTKGLINQADLTNGAYLFIQFGHNDAKDDYRYTEPGRHNSYYNELKAYVDQARGLGVIPVLITSVNRQYVGSRTHGQYPQTMRYLAEDENVILLDLEYKSFIEFKKYDSDAALQNVFSYDDGTHFNPTGAGIVAGWVKELACQKNQTLCSQFK